MRIQTWEQYVPDVEDNRARHARGDAAIVVALRPMTARVWTRFWLAIAEDPARSRKLIARRAEYGDEAGTHVTLQLALLDDELAALLWLPSVGAIEGLHPEGGDPILDGAALWALRDQLDHRGSDLYLNVLRAILDRATLEAGLARFLASASGRRPSLEPGNGRDGTAMSVAPAG